MNDRFWQYVCGARPVWGIGLAFNVLFVVLLAVSLPFVRVGTMEFYVVIVSAVMVVPMLTFTVYVLYRCQVRDEVL